jgi:hypothetical protein
MEPAGFQGCLQTLLFVFGKNSTESEPCRSISEVRLFVKFTRCTELCRSSDYMPHPNEMLDVEWVLTVC